MDKNTKNMWVIAISTILVMIIMAVITLLQANKIAEQNREDIKNLINKELKILRAYPQRQTLKSIHRL